MDRKRKLENSTLGKKRKLANKSAARETSEESSSVTARVLRKRKLVTSADPVDGSPHDKKQKIFDMLQLPVEMLLKIFNFLKKEDKSMKALTETCKKFKTICEPRLVLRLDFDRIRGNEAFPTITRAYKEISMVGEEVARNRMELKKVLRSSRDSVETLFIGADPKKPGNKYCKINQRTLLFILRYLPHVRELTINRVKVLLPRLKCEAIEPDEFPALPNLRSLSLYKNYGVFESLKEVNSVIKLQINAIKAFAKEGSQIDTFVKRQSCLEVLKLDTFCYLEKNSLPNLREFDGEVDEMMSYRYLEGNNFPEGTLLDCAPNLENVTIRGIVQNGVVWRAPQFLIFAATKSTKLKTLEYDGPMYDGFDLPRVCENYPSLIAFNSNNFNWQKLDL